MAKRGFSLPCPRCGEAEQVRAFLDDLGGDGNDFTCVSCDGEFSGAEVRTFVERWSTYLAWVDTLPTVEE